MNINKKLFEIFQTKENDYFLFLEIQKLIQSVITDTEGETNAHFYSVISYLQNEINNASWEKKHSEIIDYLNEQSYKITSYYEKYLK